MRLSRGFQGIHRPDLQAICEKSGGNSASETEKTKAKSCQNQQETMNCGQLCGIVDNNVDNLCIVVDDADHMFEMIYAPKPHDVNHQIPRGTHQPTCPEDRLTLSATTMADWIRQIISFH